MWSFTFNLSPSRAHCSILCALEEWMVRKKWVGSPQTWAQESFSSSYLGSWSWLAFHVCCLLRWAVGMIFSKVSLELFILPHIPHPTLCSTLHPSLTLPIPLFSLTFKPVPSVSPLLKTQPHGPLSISWCLWLFQMKHTMQKFKADTHRWEKTWDICLSGSGWPRSGVIISKSMHFISECYNFFLNGSIIFHV